MLKERINSVVYNRKIVYNKNCFVDKLLEHSGVLLKNKMPEPEFLIPVYFLIPGLRDKICPLSGILGFSGK